MNNQIFLNPTQAAELLGVKIATIYKWVHFKQIPYRKHGRLLRFNRQSLIGGSNRQEIQPYLNQA